MRCAVQVPEHIVPRQVPDPEVAVRWPKPTARFIPLASVTWILPVSATRPDAIIGGLVDATWPSLMPIETVAPLAQAALGEAIWTSQEPSNAAAAPGVATAIPTTNTTRGAIAVLRQPSITSPFP